jgi:glyoxylase-like metal-dependent hydrolase (beta-lactamase superfamily II)
MMNSLLAMTLTFALVSIATGAEWRELAPGVYRQDVTPAAYVVVDDKQAIGFGAPAELDLAALEQRLGCRVDTILLTHAHRDAGAAAERLVAEKRIVRAPKLSEPWLSPAGVAKYWADSVVMSIENPPLKHRRWAQWYYFVPARGVEGVRFDLTDGDGIRVGKWTVKAVATPGHSPDHTSYIATREGDAARIVFCGDAFSREGKLHTPFTTEWHHQQPDGLIAAAESLRRLAAIEPTMLCPEHGEVLTMEIDAALAKTADAIRRAAVAKGFDTWLAASGRTLPNVKFLAPDQVGSANADGNTKPWTKLSPHLYFSGNTYAIASRDGSILLVDPYHRALPEKLAELKRDHGVGPVEAMTISHAHNDHYTGVFAFSEKERPPVWALDVIAQVIEDPDRNRAPYVDPRPVPIARQFHNGEEVQWREYRLKFHHLPGQTAYGMGLELEIDGRKVLFTGDNFYRHDQYSGSGGWSGHNRGLPYGYVESIHHINRMKPSWILAEHGGAIDFSADDFAARLEWAKEAAAAADALSASGDHRRDWDPHAVGFSPTVMTVAAGEEFTANIVGPGFLRPFRFELEPSELFVTAPKPSGLAGTNHTLIDFLDCGLRDDARLGLHVVPLRIIGVDCPDCVLVLRVGPKK